MAFTVQRSTCPGRTANSSLASRQRLSPRLGLSRSVAATPEHSTNVEVGGLEPSRLQPLPNNAMWLLDYLQDKWYDVRGPTFVIQRAEHGSIATEGGAARRVRKPKVVAPVPTGRTMQLVHKAMRQFPGSMMLLEGGVVDVTELLDQADEEEQTAAQQALKATVTANHTCTGMVWVPREADENEAEDGSAEVFFTSSTSPRRTKVIGFTCKCCGARNHSAINPQSFLKGTLVAQCASCQRWHKLSDHFGLFHTLQGPVMRGKPAVTWEDVPPSLRPQQEHDDGLGWEGDFNLN